MRKVCRVCGSTESGAVAEARKLGLEPELQTGVYTCCQIMEWAREQSLVWLKAAQEDRQPVDEVAKQLELDDAEAWLVPVRTRRSGASRLGIPGHLA